MRHLEEAIFGGGPLSVALALLLVGVQLERQSLVRRLDLVGRCKLVDGQDFIIVHIFVIVQEIGIGQLDRVWTIRWIAFSALLLTLPQFCTLLGKRVHELFLDIRGERDGLWRARRAG